MAYINHELKALFLHNVKCGGCYVREILMKYYNFIPYVTEKHQYYKEFFDVYKKEDIVFDNCDHAYRKYGTYRYTQTHQDVDKQILEKYFVFTFVRNPYEKFYSSYSYLKLKLSENKDKINNTYENVEYFHNIKTFIKNKENVNKISFYHSFITQYDQLIDKSNGIKINYIGKTENLDNELIKILLLLGVKEILHKEELYYKIKHNTSIGEGIETIYDEEILDYINNNFNNDFIVFKYPLHNNMNEFKESLRVNHATDLTKIDILNMLLNIDYYVSKIKDDNCDKYEKIIEIMFSNFLPNRVNSIENIYSNIKTSIATDNHMQIDIVNKINTIKQYVYNLIKKELKNSERQCERCGFKYYNNLSGYSHKKHCK